MKIEFIRHIKDNLVLYIFALVIMCIGIAIGSLYSVGIDESQSNELGVYISDFIKHYRDKDIEFEKIFKYAFSNNFWYVLVCFLVSLTVYTVFAVYVVLAIRGFSLGFTVGVVVSKMGAKGFFLVLCTVLPSSALTLPLYLFMSTVCVKCAYARHRVRENYRENKRHLKVFIVLMLLIFVVLVLCSLVDTFLSPVLVKYLF